MKCLPQDLPQDTLFPVYISSDFEGDGEAEFIKAKKTIDACQELNVNLVSIGTHRK